MLTSTGGDLREVASGTREYWRGPPRGGISALGPQLLANGATRRAMAQQKNSQSCTKIWSAFLTWGEFGAPALCSGSDNPVNGFDIGIEPEQGGGDGTAANERHPANAGDLHSHDMRRYPASDSLSRRAVSALMDTGPACGRKSDPIVG